MSTKSEGKESTLGKKTWAIIGVVSSLLSLGAFPPVFGLAGAFSGYQVFKTNETQGVMLMIFAGICLSLGMIIGYYMGLT